MMMRLAEEEEGHNVVTHHFDLLFFLLAGCVKNAGLWWCRPARIGAIIASPLRFPVYNNAIQDDRGGSTLLRCKKPQQGVVGGPLPFFDCHSSVWYYPLQTVSSSYSSLWMYLCVYIYIHLFFLTLWARCYCCQSDGRIEEYPLRFFLSFFLFPSKVIRIAYAVRLSELVCHTQKKFEIRSLFFFSAKKRKEILPPTEWWLHTYVRQHRKNRKNERKNLLLVLLLKFLIFWPGAGLSTSLSSSSSFVFTCDYFSSSLFLGLVKKRVGLSVVCVHERVPTLLTWRTHGSLALCLSQLASLSCVTSCTSSLGRELYDLLRSPASPPLLLHPSWHSNWSKSTKWNPLLSVQTASSSVSTSQLMFVVGSSSAIELSRLAPLAFFFMAPLNRWPPPPLLPDQVGRSLKRFSFFFFCI